MPASSLIRCVPAVDLVNWIESDWFTGQQGALLVPSAKSIKGFKNQQSGPADSCQFDNRMYEDIFIYKILKEYPEELRARLYTLEEKVISL